MKFIAIKIILILSVVFLNHDLQAQVETYRPADDSYVLVKGTSTIHDWEMISENIVSEVRFKTNDDGKPEQLESVFLRLNKTTLKSDRSGLDRRAYEAMNATRHTEIIFRTNGSGRLEKNGGNYQIEAEGELTIAGNTRQVNVQATCINGDDNELVCSGSKKLKMTDFNINPPVMMLGALRTRDEVTISYRIVYTQ